MKKTFKAILAIVCVTAIFLTCGEYPDGSVGLWNFGCLAVAAIAGYGLKRMEEAK